MLDRLHAGGIERGPLFVGEIPAQGGLVPERQESTGGDRVRVAFLARLRDADIFRHEKAPHHLQS